MLDLETMGNGPTSAIISIGAVYFDKTGLGDTFYQKISLASAVDAGCTMDPSTVLWWMNQSYDARREFIGNSKEASLEAALDAFASFYKPSTLLWGNGSDFDNAILANAYRALGKKQPWAYKNNRCYRTVKNLFPDAPKPADNSLAHNALEDARWQAKHMVMIWKAISLTPAIREVS